MKLINDDRIDKYITGELQGEERKAFEEAMRADEALRTSVDFYKEVAFSAARVHDLEVLSQHRQKSFKYRWQLFWAKFRLTIISVISTIGIAAAGLGTDAIMAVQRFLQATNPYVTQLVPAIARDGESSFDEVDKRLKSIEDFLSNKDTDSAQKELDNISTLLSDIQDSGIYSMDDMTTYLQTVEFTQAVIYAQDGKGTRARRMFRKIASQESNIYRDDARNILKK